MTLSKTNQKILDLWYKYFKDKSEVLAPLFYGNLKKNTLLFVGLNPSFSARGFTSILKDTPYADIDPVGFYAWSNIYANPNLIDDSIKIESYAKAKYSQYFARPIEMSKKLQIDWEHIDIFLYKETSQSDFVKRIYDANSKKLNQFALDQITLFEEILFETEPRCVVVSNAFGSALIREQFKNNLIWDEGKGFHWFIKKTTDKGDIKIPIFFTSMLSGQRSLDRWSYERLVWQIGRV